MLDPKFIRENLELIRTNCKHRNVQVDFEKLVNLDVLRRETIITVEQLRKTQNETAQKMKGQLSAEDRQELISKGRSLKQEEAELSSQLEKIEADYIEIARSIPNLTHPNSPIAAEESGNKPIRQWGKPTQFHFAAKDHVQLGEALDLFDFDAGARVSGQKFYYLKNEAVLLELALTQYALSILLKKGFTPFMTPDLARASILEGIGFNPRGAETQVYSVENTDLCLIGTAEITLGGYLADSIIDESELPKRFVGVSHCFRTEAGAGGKESKGLYRVHQFTKVEMFAFSTPETSEKIHEEFVQLEEEIFQGLEIPYRVLDICSGDLGGPAYRKYDLEAWMPGRGEKGDWGEVTSTSNCTDYQSRRLKIRYRRENDKKVELVHMLNGTAVAISRAMIALIENHQQADGSITIPKALQPYMLGKTHISAQKAYS